MTSEGWAGRFSTRVLLRRAPASWGVLAKTPDCIFTPDGMPMTGAASPITSIMSRAVPSPPVNIRTSTPAFRMAVHASLVSFSPVGSPGVYTTVTLGV